MRNSQDRSAHSEIRAQVPTNRSQRAETLGGNPTRWYWWRLIPRAALFALANAILIPLYLIAIGPAARVRRPMQVLWSRITRWTAGLHVKVLGEPHKGARVLFVCNHVSYLDIPVLSGETEASFVAKAEVSRWPLFGLIAKLTNTVFVHRQGRDAMAQRHELAERMERGESLILFPEGTSTDGSTVAPFKSSLFSIVDQAKQTSAPAAVQPVSIAYVETIDGLPLVGELRSLYCWFGEATFFPHMVRVLGLKGAVVELRFHPPVPIEACLDRKDLARRAHAAVLAGTVASQARLPEGLLPGNAPKRCSSGAPPATSAETDPVEPVCRP